MTKSDQIKILNDKIKANNVQYKIDRLNAEISLVRISNINQMHSIKQNLSFLF